MKTLFRVMIIFLSWFLALSANIILVPQDQPGIQAGINAAVNGDTVLVADSIYFENINFIGKAITVASYMIMDNDTTHRDNTIINGSQPVNPDVGSVITFQSGEDTTSVLYGLTITGGSGTLEPAQTFRAGGGIVCINCGCKLVGNKIINNMVTGPAAYGGGVATVLAPPYNDTTYVVLKGNQIEHNTVTANSASAFGGGLWLRSHGKILANLISNNTCIGNASSIQAAAGGIGCLAAQPLPSREIIMENNTITHNSVHSYCNISGSSYPACGGVLIQGCNGKMTKNEISFNEVWDYSNLGSGTIGVGVGASPGLFIIEGNNICNNAYKEGSGNSYGGGMQVYGAGNISVINNIIEGNVATYGGGLVVFNTSTVQIVNNTIINNKSTYGGGISVHDATGYVMNTIVWGNEATTHAGIHVESGSIHLAYSDVQGVQTGPGNKNFNPELIADSLSNISPCIGIGIHSYDFGGGMICYCPLEDINGRMRPYPAGSNPDMGAWESLLDSPSGIDLRPVATVPQECSISQNYPNPFNPSTTIKFTLPKSEFAELKVYNILGCQISTIVSKELNQGNHIYQFDGENLASGIYYYQLVAGDYREVKKMILLK